MPTQQDVAKFKLPHFANQHICFPSSVSETNEVTNDKNSDPTREDGRQNLKNALMHIDKTAATMQKMTRKYFGLVTHA